MKKFLNAPERFVDEMLEGIYMAYPDRIEMAAGDPRCVVCKKRKTEKVSIVTGGGSGHLPLFLEYVREGLLDGCAVGGVFQSPSAEQIFNVTRAVESGKGVLYLFGNYTGDVINFEMASEMADMEGYKTAIVLGQDDIASAPENESQKRRGVAGIVFLYKVAAALAEEGAALEEVRRVAEKAATCVRSMGVALTPCILPEVGKPSFTLAEDEMEIGMGIHGEPGVRRGPIRPADEVVEEMLLPILEELQVTAGDRVSVLLNGLGGTCREELFICFRKAAKWINERKIALHSAYVGEFATSMEMAGFSISVMKLDNELARLLEKPAPPFFC